VELWSLLPNGALKSHLTPLPNFGSYKLVSEQLNSPFKMAQNRHQPSTTEPTMSGKVSLSANQLEAILEELHRMIKQVREWSKQSRLDNISAPAVPFAQPKTFKQPQPSKISNTSCITSATPAIIRSHVPRRRHHKRCCPLQPSPTAARLITAHPDCRSNKHQTHKLPQRIPIGHNPTPPRFSSSDRRLRKRKTHLHSKRISISKKNGLFSNSIKNNRRRRFVFFVWSRKKKKNCCREK
jgi:hypothetical protein